MEIHGIVFRFIIILNLEVLLSNTAPDGIENNFVLYAVLFISLYLSQYITEAKISR